MTEPLHTDDPTKPGNLSAEEYTRRQEQRAAEAGDQGLHVIPAEYLPGGEKSGLGR